MVDSKQITVSSLLSNTEEIKDVPSSYDSNVSMANSIQQPLSSNKNSSPMSVLSLINPPKVDDLDLPQLSNGKSISKKTSPEKETNVPSNMQSTTNKKVKKVTTEEPEKEKTANSGKSQSHKKEKQAPMIISIDLPLSTHNDVHTEYNFSKLVEEKYGYDSQTPLTKGLWNFEGEDEEEEEEEADDDTELDGLINKTNNVPKPDSTSDNDNSKKQDHEEEDEIVRALQIKFTPGMSDMEKENLVLKEIHRRKMVNNKRIGKYDIDDPFIDDEELVYEEEAKSNADGWFIWYGKLDLNKKTPVSNNNSTTTSTAANSSYVNRSKPLPDKQGPISSKIERRRKEPTEELLPPSKKGKKTLSSTSPTTTITSKSVSAEPIDSIPNPKDQKEKDKAKDGKDKNLENSTSKTDQVPTGNKLIIGSFGF